MQVDCVGKGRRAARVGNESTSAGHDEQERGNPGKKRPQDAKEARPSRGRQITGLHPQHYGTQPRTHGGASYQVGWILPRKDRAPSVSLDTG